MDVEKKLMSGENNFYK